MEEVSVLSFSQKQQREHADTFDIERITSAAFLGGKVKDVVHNVHKFGAISLSLPAKLHILNYMHMLAVNSI